MGRLFLTKVDVFDGIGDTLLRNYTVVVEDGKVMELFPTDGGKTLENGEIVDLSGYTLTPGFIDCHMHMLLEEVTDKEQSLSTTSPGGERLDTAQAAVAYLGAYNCRRMLDAGFTTVIDGGGNNYIECALKEAIQKGYLDGPDLYIAGKQITTNKAHFVGFSIEPYGPYGMRKAIRDLMYHSVDHIKLQLSPPIRMIGRNSQACDFTVEEIEAAIDEAHNYATPVHAHLRGAEAIKRFLRADGDLVVHGIGIDEEGIDLMLKKDRYLLETLLSPTPTPSKELVGAKNQATLDLLQTTAKRHWKSVKMAYEAGVKLAFSTDAGTLGITVGSNALEFLNLQKIGMSCAEALKSATSVAAEAIGHADTIGRVAPGYRANFAVLQGNPLEDLSATQRVVMTWKDGKIMKDTRKQQ